MKLIDSIRLYASASTVSKSTKTVFNKKMGKQNGLDAIESDLRTTVEKAAKKVGGTVNSKELDKFITERRGFLKNSFKQLDNPSTDKSQDRADLIGDHETRTAKAFGKWQGYKSRKGSVQKQWLGGDCDLCSANEDDGPIDVDEEFSSGDMFAPAHLNCDCEVVYVRGD
jgi:hypothetical protein